MLTYDSFSLCLHHNSESLPRIDQHLIITTSSILSCRQESHSCPPLFRCRRIVTTRREQERIDTLNDSIKRKESRRFSFKDKRTSVLCILQKMYSVWKKMQTKLESNDFSGERNEMTHANHFERRWWQNESRLWTLSK
jgi:hypothetical protein